MGVKRNPIAKLFTESRRVSTTVGEYFTFVQLFDIPTGRTTGGFVSFEPVRVLGEGVRGWVGLGRAVVNLHHVLAEDLPARIGGELLGHLLDFLDVVAGVIGMRKIAGPEKLVGAD